MLHCLLGMMTQQITQKISLKQEHAVIIILPDLKKIFDVY